MKCPKCGSHDVRDTYVKTGLNFGGQVAAHVLMLPGHALGGIIKNPAVNKWVCDRAQNAGGRIAEAFYNKKKCRSCGHIWRYEVWSD
ncbi:MAG: hypothetical protein K2N05_04525 [Muribaculaceae bacterium]|nr:hypothetical protein [Muribaculaceae bacterium]